MNVLGTLSVRKIILLWVAWAIVVIGFQGIVNARFQPDRPDYVLSWTKQDTAIRVRHSKPYLIDPFLNHQVNMDSEYYLSIAVVGYDDPIIPPVDIDDGSTIARSYAFFPLYPYLMRAVSIPLSIFGLTPIGTAALAGVIISLLGGLIAMLALYDLVRDELGDEGGFRAIFYLLIFPTGFYLAQVYTEGLFLGLAFACLALARRKHLLWAAILSVFAVWTRAVGIGLIIPLALAWYHTVDWTVLRGTDSAQRNRALLKTVGGALLVLAPLASYLVWRALFGTQFELIEENFFGRMLFNWEQVGSGFQAMLDSFRDGSNPQATVYYAIETLGVLGALGACLLTLKRYPAVALFGLVALIIPVTSGAPQSLIRYVLVVPSLYIVLARWGKNAVFDRTWTMLSLLTMGMLLTLYTFDMWVS